jgi:predicted KAP-like P-loop ATPase
VEVLLYECQRAFKDRIVNQESKQKFDSVMEGLAKKHFDTKVKESIYTSLTGTDKLINVTPEDFVKLIENGIKSYEREVKAIDFIILQE